MAQGYLVTLGNGNLDPNDQISGPLTTFDPAEIIGAGSWTWTGTWSGNGQQYSNITDTGTYTYGLDGNVYFTPDNWYVDTIDSASVTTAPAYSPVPIVEGTTGDDVIDAAYVDPDGDQVSAGREIVDGGTGDDQITSFDGNDTVYGGEGSDTITSGAGDDTIYGDSSIIPTASEQTFSWTDQGGEGVDATAPFTQNTGDIDVTVTITDLGNLTTAAFSTDTQYVAGTDAASNSALEIRGTGNGGSGVSQTAEVQFDFAASTAGISDEVANVTFRINDIDEATWDDRVTVLAYDAAGTAIPVTFTPEGNVTQFDADTVDGGGPNTTAASQNGSALITVSGPVARIEIIYENAGDATQALWITDLTFDAISSSATSDDTIFAGDGNDTVFGEAGDDMIEGGAGDDTISGGSGADTIDGGADNDTIDGGIGNDTLDGGTGDDIIDGGSGDDIIRGGDGQDTLSGGDGADDIEGGAGNDSIDGGAGNDTIDGGTGDDSIDGGAGNDTITGGTGNDTLDGGDGDDNVTGGAGDDTITGGAGDDLLYGGTGSDRFEIKDSDETDTIEGGEDAGDGDIDTVDFSSPTSSQGVDVSFTGDESGTYAFDGTPASGSFSEIERVETTDFDDSIDASATTTGTQIDAGAGADQIQGGSGDDQIDLGGDGTGNPDGDADVVTLVDGFGNDTISNFDFPIDNGDGTFTGVDTFDVTSLTDAGGVPVNTSDVTVSDDGSGNAVLTFPNGESVTLLGIAPASVTPVALNAMGIPSDGIVEGSAAADTIDADYTGDPDGDLVDNNDAILAGEVGDDDIIYGYAGDDTILAGAGDDDVFAGDDDDTIDGGTGDDTLRGEAGDDTFTLTDGFGTDTITGGETAEDAGGDTLDASALTNGATLDLSQGDPANAEDGTLTQGANTATFSEIENVTLTGQDDTLIGSTGADTVDMGAGSDTVDGGAGDDVIGLGSDGAGGTDGDADTVTFADGDGNDTYTDFDAPIDNGDGTFTGIDAFDVSGMTDTYGNPVNTNDVTVADDGSGNAVLVFPNGESVTLIGVTPAQVSDPLALEAIGIPLATPDGIVSGTSGDDLINATYDGDPEGDFVDNDDAILAGEVGDDDIIEAGAGNDTVYAGAGNDEVIGEAGDDTIFGGAGNDQLDGGSGDDTLSGGAGTDTLTGGTGNDTLSGGSGDDTMSGGDGDDAFVLASGYGIDTITGGEAGETQGDTIDASGLGAGITVDLSQNGGGDTESGTVTQGGNVATFSEIENIIYTQFADTAVGSSAADTISTGAGDDILSGGQGADTLTGGDGDDSFVLANNFGNDVITGGEGGENGGSLLAGFTGDLLDASGLGNNLTVTLSGAETGTLSNGTFTASFSEIEIVATGSGDDTITGATGSQTILTGTGSDTVDAGAGDDTVILGDDSLAGDGDVDTLVFSDGDGADTIIGFDAPTLAGNGTYSGTDQLDVSGMTNAAGDPVTTADVTVTEVGGNAVLTFPNGESLTLVGVSSAEVQDQGALFAMGIPSDGIVSGTSAGEVIDVNYDGDPDGDFIDNNDAKLAGDTGDDDYVLAGAGDDTIFAGDGDDEVYGEAGDDSFIIENQLDNDILVGGETGETAGDFIDITDLNVDLTVNFTGSEQGTISDGTATTSFSEIERIELGRGDDVVIGGAGDDNVILGRGADTATGGAGDDTFDGGNGDDSLTGGEGSDTLIGGRGDDQLFVSEGDTAIGGDGDDTFTLQDFGEAGTNDITIIGGEGREGVGDTLKLGTVADLTSINITNADDNNGGLSGTVTMRDGSVVTFSEIENIICFTPGTRIATPQGYRNIEDLQRGDLVVTRDHGLQPIRWIESRRVPAVDRFAPIRIRPGVVTGAERDLLVSPQHRMLFQGYRAELLFGESEVLVAAKHLVDDKLVTREIGGEVTYIHMMFDSHEIVFAEGAASESFHPGDVGLSAVSDAARDELFTLFPQLRADQSVYGRTARRVLKKHEAGLLGE